MDSDSGWKSYRKLPVIIQARPAFDWETVYTLEGAMKAKPGDMIIRGVAGELYPCDPEIFARTYEQVESGDGQN